MSNLAGLSSYCMSNLPGLSVIDCQTWQVSPLTNYSKLPAVVSKDWLLDLIHTTLTFFGINLVKPCQTWQVCTINCLSNLPGLSCYFLSNLAGFPVIQL